MTRTMPTRFLTALGIATLFAVAPAALAAAPQPLATRSLMLEGGGRIEVGTRYHLPDYRTGDAIRIDPVLNAVSGSSHVPEILTGSVELRPHGFAPCLAAEKETQADCVAGTLPATQTEGSPTSFSFAFLKLFNTSEGDGTSSPNWFGYASFVVTLRVRASDGAEETVRFPLTVTVQQTAMDLSYPTAPLLPATTRALRLSGYPVPVVFRPQLRDRDSATGPVE